MLEASLSMVAAFAAYTVYAIVGDEIKANRPAKKPAGKRTATQGTKAFTAQVVQPAKAPVKTKAAAPRISRAAKRDKAANPDTILAYLAAHGPVTIANLAKALKVDKEAMAVEASKLIKKNAAVAIEKKGYPGIAPKS